MFESKRSMACSFCGKHHADVAKLVAGPRFVLRRVYICDSCVSIAARLVADPDGQAVEYRPASVESPSSRVKDSGIKRVAFA